METTIIGNGGTKGADTGFTFPFVVDKTSTFDQFRGAISDKYPWGIFDAVEFRYCDMQNTVWVPVQNDDELGVMFATNVESNSVQLEINVIQRKRGETESRVARSAPNPSQPRSNQTSRRKATTSESRGRKLAATTSEPGSSQARRGNGTHSIVQQPGTPSANLPSQPCPEYSKATTDPIIEEEFPDEVPIDDEDERMHPEFVVRKPPNEDDGEDYIPPPQFEETDSNEREEDMDMGYSETEDEDEPAATNEDDAVEETKAQADPEDDAPVPVSDAPTVASAAGTTVSPRKNYKRPAERGDNPLSPKKKLKGDMLTFGGSQNRSNQLSVLS
ncbi:hypothetical protein ZWY2020_044184 [Hordeum vulgare]|nr:hypothetical protein ZWY2020_044184 [Hordeum vulgare]